MQFPMNAGRRAEQLGESGVSRRSVLLRGGVVAGAGLLLGGAAVAAAQGNGRTVTLDVACDGRTWRMVRMDPANARNQLARRGDTFIVNGKIYPAGTIDRGLTGPDQPGSIGTWICRGTFYVEDVTTQTPHVTSVQMHHWENGDALVHEGLEGGVNTTRAVIGGMGAYMGARGQVAEEAMGENDTTLDLGAAQVPAPNLRFTFTLI